VCVNGPLDRSQTSCKLNSFAKGAWKILKIYYYAMKVWDGDGTVTMMIVTQAGKACDKWLVTVLVGVMTAGKFQPSGISASRDTRRL
jgi:hypothetical protein